MRLIDADELLKHRGNCYDEDGHLLYAVGTGHIIKAPTIEAMPVVYGRWTTHRTLEHDGEWYCSVCGTSPLVYESTPYCPFCGAKMREEI